MSSADIIIIGASLAGLMHALVLRSLGRNVRVFESRSGKQLQARAAGLSLWAHAQELITKYMPDIELDAFTFPNREVCVLDGEGRVLSAVPVVDDIRTTSWAVVHKMLWRACVEKESRDGEGSVSLENGTRVCGIEEDGDRMVVTIKNAEGVEEIVRAGLVIAADGAQSFVRSRVLPTVKPVYAGYLAWRGSLLERDAPPELECVLKGALANFPLGGSYILVYLTPSAEGSIEPGERLLEWCWYDMCEADSSEFNEFMTDNNGIRHNITVPADLLAPSTWKRQLARRGDIVPPLWQKLFAKSTEHSQPLLTAIQSFENETVSYFDRKLWLAGEAFCQIRPHIGASCSIPALQAMTLGQVLRGEKTWEEAQQTVVDYASMLNIGSMAVGAQGMAGTCIGADVVMAQNP